MGRRVRLGQASGRRRVRRMYLRFVSQGYLILHDESLVKICVDDVGGW